MEPHDCTPPVVLGLDFGGTKIAAAVCDVRTATAARHDHGRHAGRRWCARATFAARSSRAAAALLDGVARRAARWSRVGASTFGIPTDDGVALAPTIPGLGRAAARPRSCAGAFPGAEVRLATDVKAAAAAEARVRRAGRLRPRPLPQPRHRAGRGDRRRRRGAVRPARRGRRDRLQPARPATTSGVALADRIPLEDAVSGKALLGRAPRLLPGATARRRSSPARRAIPADDRGARRVRQRALAPCRQPRHRRRPGPDRGGRRAWSGPGPLEAGAARAPSTPQSRSRRARARPLPVRRPARGRARARHRRRPRACSTEAPHDPAQEGSAAR